MMQPPMFDPNRNQSNAAEQQSNTALLNNMAGAENSSHTQVIWGTNINTNDVQMKLKNFINNFEEIRDDDDDDDDEQYIRESYYMTKLKEVRQQDQNVLEVDCDHIFQFDPTLYRQIVDYPTDVIPIFDLMVTQSYRDLALNMNTLAEGENQHMNDEFMDDNAELD